MHALHAWSIRPCSQAFPNLNKALIFFGYENCNFIRRAKQIDATQTYHKRGSPPDNFCDFRKKWPFNAVWITVYTLLEPFEKTKLLKFGSHSKESNCSTLPYLQIKLKTSLNARI